MKRFRDFNKKDIKIKHANLPVQKQLGVFALYNIGDLQIKRPLNA